MLLNYGEFFSSAVEGPREHLFKPKLLFYRKDFFYSGIRRAAGGADVEITLKPHRFNSLELCEFLMNRKVVGCRISPAPLSSSIALNSLP